MKTKNAAEKILNNTPCPNPNCISNYEPMKSRLVVLKEKPLKVECHYCERAFGEAELKKE